MTRYIIKRLTVAVFVFFGITLLVYVLVSFTPGSPVVIMLGEDIDKASPERIAQAEAALGLDKPILVRYWRWLVQLLQGNLGISYRTKQSVLSMILSRLGPTLLLSISSILISVAIAVPLGVMAAYRPYTGWDYISSGFAFVGTSVPNFFVALLLIYFFAVQLGWLPTSGMYDSASTQTIPSLLKHLISPMLALASSQIGSVLRQTRGSMLEALHGDYIRSARAQGVSEFRVVLRHGLRNALLPIITVIGGRLPFIIGGAVVIEQLFSWPGMGSLMVTSINARDYSVVLGITVFISLMVLAGNILVDIAYGLADPRIRQSR